MLLCYFISKKDFSIINCIEAESYSCVYNLDCGGKTKIVVAGNPNAADEDFVILKDEKSVKFKGIIENIGAADDELKHIVSCLEIERIFDRKILLSDEDLIRETGIEDFVVRTIKTYFSESGDDFIDMSYINCQALTHTKVSAKPATEKGIYNFKTYIGNIKQNYGIFLDFEFEKERLNIYVHKKAQAAMQIDTTISDVIHCNEIYKVKVLSKLNVVWLNTLTQEESLRYFYLHPDRSTSESNKNRIDGTISTIRIEAETEEEMIQEAKNEFKSNSYSHSIEADILATSSVYPFEEFYAGHEVRIKTGAAGIQESIISEVSFNDAADVVSVTFGILKVKLTDKLK